MYKISVPIALESISDGDMRGSLEKYLDYFKKGNIERVFVCCLSPVYSDKCEALAEKDKFENTIRFFKENGMEVGVWVGGFGHGVRLTHECDSALKRNYRPLTGVTGEQYGYAYCPLDKNFTDDYMSVIKQIAYANPDIIMVDDDFRLNGRCHHYMGCFCEEHLREFYRLTGEEIPRCEIEEKVFSGGGNKYRDAYMNMCAKTLLDFAGRFRATVDEVNPNIRAGACTTPSNWDLSGTDALEIARAFAGRTRPFMRPFGAPYHDKYTLIDVIEEQRMQMSWKNGAASDIEAFSEGDVYPRPRYNVPSKSLELFDIALMCDGGADGILKYMFDYDMKVGYEEGYIESHIKNLEIKNNLSQIFGGKKCIGITVFSTVHKIRTQVFPKKAESGIVRKLENAVNSYAADILSKNSIPTCYEKSDYPVAVFGENARHIPLTMLDNGAVLDSAAAVILKERGVDTGITGVKKMADADGEYYIKNDGTVRNLNVEINGISCSDSAEVLSLITPSQTPGAYKYQNADGQKFAVFAADFQNSPSCANYFNNYYRQAQVAECAKWLCGRKLPAVCTGNPNLYIMTAKDEKSVSVLLVNICMDEIDKPEITLDRKYGKIKFVGCNGELNGDTVNLTKLAPYGFAAFEAEI